MCNNEIHEALINVRKILSPLGVVFSSRHNDYFCLFVVSEKCKKKKRKRSKKKKKKKKTNQSFAFTTEKQNNEDFRFFSWFGEENIHRKRARFSISA